MIAIEDRGGVRLVTMQHGKANAFDLEFARELEAAFRAANEDEGVRAVVVTGTRSIFSAGVDLTRLLDEGPDYVQSFLGALDGVFGAQFCLEKPCVAAVNGHAIAGGGVLVCAADYRVMAAGRGTVGVPELVVGVPFPPIAFEIVRAAVPRQYLHSFVLLGQTVLPDAAKECGFVDEVVEADLVLGRSLEVAERLGDIPAETFRITKRQLREETYDRARACPTGEAVRDAWKNPATLNAVRSYVAKTLKK